MKAQAVLSSIAILAIAAVTILSILRSPQGGDADGTMVQVGEPGEGAGHDEAIEDGHEGGHSEDEEFERGPHGGRLLEAGNFSLEVAIYETGIAPEFRLYAYRDQEPVPPADFGASIVLTRLGGLRDEFAFEPEADYRRGLGVVREPHSFDVDVTAEHDGEVHRFAYESHEGRTGIPARVAAAQGIEVETAGPATITDVVELTGTVQTDPARIAEVRARFPGIVTGVQKTLGDTVTRGEVLATVETNESLRSVAIEAPIGGLIVERNIQTGQATGDAALYVIADLSRVWISLDVFGRDLDAIAVGQRTVMETLGGRRIESAIDWVSPLVAHGSQSANARVTVANPDFDLRPGQFVRARVTAAEHEVPLAVRRSALQRFRDFDVVFARVADVYEVRMLELGRQDADFVEVLGGLAPGEVYVTGNSYLIKADIEKSGASHDH